MAKGVKIKLDRKRHLLVTSQGIADFERVTGKPLLGKATLTGNLSFKDIIAMTWALLLHEDSQLTLDQVSDMIRPQTNMTELMYKIGEAWAAYDKELG